MNTVVICRFLRCGLGLVIGLGALVAVEITARWGMNIDQINYYMAQVPFMDVIAADRRLAGGTGRNRRHDPAGRAAARRRP